MTTQRGSIDQVRERIDIVELIGEHVQLRKLGRTFKGLCPFHQEKTPSFVVYPENQTFHCFGCGAGGDAFSFLMQIEHVEFKEALAELAKRAGVELAPAAPSERRPAVDEHARLFELNALAARFFSHVLWSTSHGEPGRELLERRGVDQVTAERFQLGYAPDRWDALLGFLGKRGATVEELTEAGLITRRDDGGAYDRFRSRLIFPIRDREGRIVGFGGRALGDAKPKYLNSPQTPIFDKSANLYAFDFALESIRATREAVVVEGYMDAIAAHQFGFPNVVASMGTALTAAQAGLLRRSVERIVLALDSDAAGQLATLRGLDLLRDEVSDADRPYLDVDGLVRFDRTLKIDLRIVRLPSGKDPDELIRKDVDAWRAALAGAVPLLDFYLDAVIGSNPPDDPRSKSEMVERLSPVLREIGDRVVQAHYVGEAARRLDVRESLLTAPPRRTNRRPQLRQPAQPGQRTVSQEEQLIALLLGSPLALAETLDAVQERDVLDAQRREILGLLRLTRPTTADEALAVMPEEVRAYAEELLALVAGVPLSYAGQLRREATQALRRLRKERHDEQVRRLRESLQELERAGDAEAVRETLGLLDQLKLAFPEFYPEPSPYFRDARDPAS
ncbi:MAG TPA: DNA primase [Thermomicrobiaceae bacterium]|nr:DNA primase [Thermomicrobiaceae bacterium]